MFDLFPAKNSPNLLIGLPGTDDAAVYRLTDDTALILTVDFFTPIVDDPYDYGYIAAVNAMSDVYAMGGRVLLALNTCAFPPGLPPDIIGEILRGGAEAVSRAGGVIAGGHTIDDNEPKYGLCVAGTVHPDRVLAKTGAVPGDAVVLTKPLGTGIITTANKGGACGPEHLAGAVHSMKQLNDSAAGLLSEAGATCCTDVTGFGLIGHAHEIASKSGVSVVLHTEALPFLPGAKRYAEESLFPGGACKNFDWYEKSVSRDDSMVTEELLLLLCTPETSGGLLAAVPQQKLKRCRALFRDAGHHLWEIGKIEEFVDKKGLRVHRNEKYSLRIDPAASSHK